MLAFNDIWISFIAPWGAMIGMYVMCTFFKINNTQLFNCSTLKQIEFTMYDCPYIIPI